MDKAEIEREIRKVEADRTTWNNCERLAMLYTVRDHLDEPMPMPTYSYAAEPVLSGDSDFMIAVMGVGNMQKVFDILDEHMEAVKLVFPKEYSMVLRKINEIK